MGVGESRHEREHMPVRDFGHQSPVGHGPVTLQAQCFQHLPFLGDIRNMDCVKFGF